MQDVFLTVLKAILCNKFLRIQIYDKIRTINNKYDLKTMKEDISSKS